MGENVVSKESGMKIETIPYNKEKVEHLISQLVKLSQAINLTRSDSSAVRIEIEAAMKILNKALEGELCSPRYIINTDFADPNKKDMSPLFKRKIYI